MFPDVPTVKEQGINFAMGMWRGLAASKGTPPEVIRKLNEGFKKAMEDPEFQQKAKDMSVILSYLGPKEFGAKMAQDDEFFGKLIKEIKK
jgi:tripartite-type tricarboxylate transporter receptor subunit TctC